MLWWLSSSNYDIRWKYFCTRKRCWYLHTELFSFSKDKVVGPYGWFCYFDEIHTVTAMRESAHLHQLISWASRTCRASASIPDCSAPCGNQTYTLVLLWISIIRFKLITCELSHLELQHLELPLSTSQFLDWLRSTCRSSPCQSDFLKISIVKHTVFALGSKSTFTLHEKVPQILCFLPICDPYLSFFLMRVGTAQINFFSDACGLKLDTHLMFCNATIPCWVRCDQVKTCAPFSSFSYFSSCYHFVIILSALIAQQL